MKALFELFRRFDARRIFGFIRRLGGMSRPKVKCYDLRSTRALRVEGDGAEIGRRVFIGISIHALRVEGDVFVYGICICRCLFLSTPSGWRATRPHPSGGHCSPISIHALRVEGDTYMPGCAAARTNFYPRPPGGGRPPLSRSKARYTTISIHALRVEGDRRNQR